MTLLMALKYFPGIENNAEYAGNFFQAIYPDAFPGDPYIGPERSSLAKAYQLSLLYMVVHYMGEIWLDDRFVFFVYLAVGFITIIGVDRIIVLAGLRDILPRLIVQLVLMRDHGVFLNKVYLLHQVDINHSAVAIPVIVWTIYAALSGKALWKILALCILMITVSIKMAPYVIAPCLLVAAGMGKTRDRLIVAGIFTLALGVFIYVVNNVIVIPEADRLALWHLIYDKVEQYLANPFYPSFDIPTTILRNMAFLALCLPVFFFSYPNRAVELRARLFIGFGLAVWLIGGVFLSFIPDALKLPHILPFSLVRALRWTQTVGNIFLLIGALHWMQKPVGDDMPNLRRIVIGFVIMLAALMVGRTNHVQWGGLFIISLLAVGAVTWLATLRQSASDSESAGLIGSLSGVLVSRYMTILAGGLALTIAVAFTSTLSKRVEIWKTWAEKGVIGDNPSAIWIDVSKYLRTNTDFDAVILPFQYSPHFNFKDKLIAHRYLASRSGRTTPVIDQYSSIFNLEGWRHETKQIEFLNGLASAIQGKEWEKVRRDMPLVVPRPDYIAIPSEFATPKLTATIPFELMAEVGKFTILRRRE